MRSNPTCRGWIRKISASSLRNSLLLLYLLGWPVLLWGQQFEVTGRAVRVLPNDTVPLDGSQIVLHRVSREGGGPVDSVLSAADGRFSLSHRETDSTAVFLVSVAHQGITYFSSAFHPRITGPDPVAEILVYDTSSTRPGIAVSQRHLIVRSPEPDGTRRVVDLVLLENRGDLTRISPDSSSPVWTGRLPDGALGLEVGQGDVSADAVYREGDSLHVLAPVPPGNKQVLVSYVVPRTARLELPVDQPTGRMNLLLEELDASVDGGVLFLGVEDLESQQFARYEGFELPGDGPVTIEFQTGGTTLEDLWWVVVLAAAVAMSLSVWWWRRSTPLQASAAPPSADQIASRIARLDLAYQQQTDPSSETEREYRSQRAELKRLLADALARSDPEH